MIPDYRIFADSTEITLALRQRLIELRVEDASGLESDMVSIKIDDRAPSVAMPRTGAELRVQLGYKNQPGWMDRMFTVDEVGLSGPPSQMTIRGRAANLRESLKARKTRPWDNVTLGDIVTTIAKEHGYAPKISSDMSSVSYDHLDQANESDLALLTRLAKDHGAVSKPVAGNLVFVPAGEAKSVSGQTLPVVEIALSDGSRYDMTLAERGKYASVIGRWHDTAAASEMSVTAGSGDPAYTLPKVYPDEAAATAAARAKYQAFERGTATLRLSCAGNPQLAAEGKINLTGGRPGVDGAWVLTRVTHALDSGGYRTDLEGETPT